MEWLDINLKVKVIEVKRLKSLFVVYNTVKTVIDSRDEN